MLVQLRSGQPGQELLGPILRVGVSFLVAAWMFCSLLSLSWSLSCSCSCSQGPLLCRLVLPNNNPAGRLPAVLDGPDPKSGAFALLEL